MAANITIDHRTISVSVDGKPLPVYSARIADNTYKAFRDAMDNVELYCANHSLTERNTHNG